MKLLVVDDERDMTELTGAYLRLHGIEVDSCNDPEEVVARLKAGSYDALVVDLMMYPMDGFSLLHEVRGLPEFSQTPIVVLSAKRLTEEERKDLLTMKVHFLPKPCHMPRLLQALQPK